MRRTSLVRSGAARAVAVTAALVVGGALIGVPAQAAPGAGEPKEPAASQPATAAGGTGDLAGALPPGLAEALQRDLGITEEEFRAAGELGQRAAAALPRLQATEGFAGLALEDAEIVIYGSGTALEALAEELDARLEAPAANDKATEAADDESSDDKTATDAGSTPAAPAPSETAAPVPSSEPAAEESAAEGTQADAAATRTATDLTSLARDYIANVGVEGLQSISLGSDGFTINVQNPEAPVTASARTLQDSAAPTTPKEFADEYTNVKAESSGSGAGVPLEDVYGGQGYAIDTGQGFFACSVGFNGWNPEGDPAVITAGHCTGDGSLKDTYLAPTDGTNVVTTELGTFGTSVFGGPGNTPSSVENPNIGTDVAVIDGINKDLDLLAEVTQWAPGGLSETTTRITGVGSAVAGLPVCRSGLTTGWKCGTVDKLAVFLVGGHKMATDPKDVRAVLGFESTLKAMEGDSGGPVISGNTALGLVSSGMGAPDGDGFYNTVGAADLTSALSVTGGYTVALHVEAPALNVKNGDTVETDQVLTGTAPAGSTVKLTVNGGTAEIPVAENGTWSMKVPRTVADGATAKITATAVIGFNESKTTTYSVTVKHSPLAAPVLTNPADGASVVNELRTLEGTADPEATVTLKVAPVSGTEEAGEAQSLAATDPQVVTAEVNENGTFSVELDEALSFGAYTVSASQEGTPGKAASPVATTSFSVIYPAPAITSLRDGEVFTEATAPETISGTGVPGATLTLTVGDADPVTEVDEDGNWTVELGTWAAGEYLVTATQELNGVGSAAATATIQVTELQVAGVANPKPSGKLPSTGVSGTTALLSAAGILLLGGAAGVGISRRRRSSTR
ncbi:trypsin-like serine protease [Arthrobacter sp. Sa2CUA1]|uniref:Trypsin-like serine protease n=1 Tax=Arthrobacter gallicola TaxID=2762225 RepID=A0ABR8UQI0_9MICC|nr:trypsin-like serine protease [Arthrobacter gallicola]MBD7994796.1 trypsin-like serine protease [Arthrobacter gallicola]